VQQPGPRVQAEHGDLTDRTAEARPAGSWPARALSHTRLYSMMPESGARPYFHASSSGAHPRMPAVLLVKHMTKACPPSSIGTLVTPMTGSMFSSAALRGGAGEP
jgi:hypothetical protein